MAEVAFPLNTARTVELRLRRENPGQITHEIPSTGARKTFTFGAGHWAGQVTFGRMRDRQSSQIMEAFIASLDGGANWTQLPLREAKTYRSATTSLQVSGSTAGSLLTHTFDNNPLEAADVGTYWNSSNRLFIVTQVDGANVALWPQLVLAADTRLTAATFVLARQDANSPTMPQTVDFGGPWSWNFVEAI